MSPGIKVKITFTIMANEDYGEGHNYLVCHAKVVLLCSVPIVDGPSKSMHALTHRKISEKQRVHYPRSGLCSLTDTISQSVALGSHINCKRTGGQFINVSKSLII